MNKVKIDELKMGASLGALSPLFCGMAVGLLKIGCDIVIQNDPINSLNTLSKAIQWGANTGTAVGVGMAVVGSARLLSGGVKTEAGTCALTGAALALTLGFTSCQVGNVNENFQQAETAQLTSAKNCPKDIPSKIVVDGNQSKLICEP